MKTFCNFNLNLFTSMSEMARFDRQPAVCSDSVSILCHFGNFATFVVYVISRSRSRDLEKSVIFDATVEIKVHRCLPICINTLLKIHVCVCYSVSVFRPSVLVAYSWKTLTALI